MVEKGVKFVVRQKVFVYKKKKVVCNISFYGFTEWRIVPNNIAIISSCADVRRMFIASKLLCLNVLL